MSLSDEEMSRLEELSGKKELSDDEMGELDALDRRGRTDPTSDFAPSVIGFTTADVSKEAADQTRRLRQDRLRAAFKASQLTNEDDAARTAAISRSLAIPFDTVRANLPAFKKTAEAAAFDADAWERDNPQLAKVLLENPDLGELVMSSKEIGPIVRNFNRATDWLRDKHDEMLRRQVEEEKGTAREADRQLLQNAAAFWNSLVVGDEKAKQEANDAFQPMTPEQRAAVEKERVARDTPKATVERQDAKSTLLKNDDSLAARGVTLLVRGMESAAQLDLSRKHFQLMVAENGGPGDVADLRKEIADAELEATPRAYGDDSGIMRDLSVGIQGGVSTVQVAKQAVEGAGVAGGVGAVAGAAAGAVATKTPAGAVEGAMLGAKTFAPTGARVGAAWGTFNLEAGSSYKELRELETDGHQRLSPGEAAGGAVVMGLLKTGLELVSFNKQTKGLQGLLPGRVKDMLAHDPTFRRLVGNLAREWFESTGTEGLTEGAQNAVDQLGAYIAASAKDDKLQKRAPVEMQQVLADAEAGALGAGLFGAVQSGLTLGLTQTSDSKSQAEQRQVGPLLEMAKLPAVQAAPGAFAKMVEDASVENGGAPVKSLYVDAHQLITYFQNEGKNGDETNAEVTKLLGDDAPAKLLDAAATGGKVEVPMEKVLSTWGNSEVGQALVEDTTTEPHALTPRQREAQKAELDARTQALVDEQSAKLDDAAHLDRLVDEHVQSLVEAGRPRAEALKSGALMRTFIETAIDDEGVSVRELFPTAPLLFHSGDQEGTRRAEVPAAAVDEPSDAEVAAELGDEPTVEDFARGLTPEKRAEMLFVDDVTGLNTRRAWDETTRTPGTQVGLVTVPDVKGINDAPKGGHEVTNRLLRLVGAKLSELAPGRMVARSGTDFLVETQGLPELEAMIAQLQAIMPKGTQALGFVGSSVEDAYKNEKSGTTERRALPKGDARRVLPRGQTAFDTSTLTDESFPGEPAKRGVPEGVQVPGEAEFNQQVFFDRQMPGVLSRAGFMNSPKRPFSASIDMRGLKKINEWAKELSKGNELGDAVLKAFGEAAMRAGGGRVFFSHMSGDEFAAKGWSQEELDLFIERFEAELQDVGVPVTLSDGSKAELVPAFRSGVAEGTYGKADQELNRRKSLEPKQPDVGAADDLRRAGVLRAERRVDVGPGTQAAVGASALGEGEAGSVLPEAAQAEGRGAETGVADRSGRSDVAPARVTPNPEIQPTDGGAAQAGDAAQLSEHVDESEPAPEPGSDLDQTEEALAAALIEQRKKNGELRQEEEEAIRAGFNRNEDIALAREAIARFKAAKVDTTRKESAQRTERRRKAAQRARDERKKAAEAFLKWVEGTGPGIVDKALAYKREGAMAVDGDLVKRVHAWARKLNIIDPSNGITALMAREARGMEGPKRTRNYESTTAGKARQRDARQNFERHVLGRLNQADSQTLDAVDAALEDELFPLAQTPEVRDAIAREIRDARSWADMALQIVRQERMGYRPAWLSGEAIDYARRAASHEMIAREIARTGEVPAVTGKVEELPEPNDTAKGWGPLLEDLKQRDRGVGKFVRLFQDDPNLTPNEQLKQRIEMPLREYLLSEGLLENGKRVGIQRVEFPSELGEVFVDAYDANDEVHRIRPARLVEQLPARPAGLVRDLNAYTALREEESAHKVELENWMDSAAELRARDVEVGDFFRDYGPAKALEIKSIRRWSDTEHGNQVEFTFEDGTKREFSARQNVAVIQQPRPAPLAQVKLGERWFQNEDEKKASAEPEPEKPKGPKGYAVVDPSRQMRSTIDAFLNREADFSTVVHEGAHAYLEQMLDLGEREGASERAKKKAKDVLEALGVESREQLRSEEGRAYHEKFARAYEAWLFEGKTAVPKLARLFRHFSNWLLRIYRSVTAIPGVDQQALERLRPVFEAMHATESQVEAARRKQGPRSPNMTEEQVEAERDEYTEATYDAQLRAMKDALRVHEAWWKQGLAKLKTTLADEYDTLPAVRAQRIISGQETGTPIPLNRAEVERVIGNARVPGLVRSLNGRMPSTVAELAGFPSGDAMLAALAALKPKEEWVAKQATDLMEQQHPAIYQRIGEFQRLIEGGLHGVTEKRLLREWSGLPKEALKSAAEKLVAQREVGRVKPQEAMALMRRAANEKSRAAARGDIGAAGDAARTELLNLYMHRGMLEAQKAREAFEKTLDRVGKVAGRSRLGKAAPEYRDAVDFIRDVVSGRKSTFDMSTITRAIAQLNGDAIIVGDPDWLEPLQKALGRLDEDSTYEDLTVGELEAVHDALKMFEAGARQRTEILVEGKKEDFEEVKKRVLEEIGGTLPPRGPLVPKGAQTLTERVKAGANALDGFLLNPIDFVRDLTGDNPNAMLHKVLVNTMRRAQSLETDLLEQTVKPIIDAIDKMPKEVRARLSEPLDSGLFPSHIEKLERPRRRAELLAMALNAGNESNIEVLTTGRGITREQLFNALNQLTKEEISWVNEVHKSLEQLREPSFALEERETGLRPEAVKAKPTSLRNGTLHGGYFPLKAEPGASLVGEKVAADDSLASFFDPSFQRPTTRHGHLKERTGATYPVTLDLDVTRKHLLQSAHDIAFREAVKAAAKLVMDRDVREKLVEHLGLAKTREIDTWLKDIGGGNGTKPTVADSILRGIKRNLSSSALSGLSTAFGNFANLAAAAVDASNPLKAKHLAAAVATWSPKQWRTAREKSGVMRTMTSDLVQQLNREMEGWTSSKAGGALEWLREASMSAMRGVDGIVSSAVWTAAYRQALAEGKDESESVRFADDVLLRVQPSQSVVEKAGILRNKGWAGAMATFYSYLSVAYRTQHRLAAPLFTQQFQASSPAAKAKAAGKVAGNLAAFYIAFGVLGELAMGRGPEAGDADDDDPENKAKKWRNWFARKLVAAPLSTVPLVPLASLFEANALGKKPNVRADPLKDAASELNKAGDVLNKARKGDEEPEKAVRAALRIAGILTGAPERLTTVTGGYVADLFTGAAAPRGPGDVVSGLLYGAREGQPDNVFTALQDWWSSAE